MTLTFATPLFLDTPDLERKVRSSDPDTSWLSAAIAPESAESVRDFIELFLSRRPGSTDERIFAAYTAQGGNKTAQRVRTARAELSKPKTGDPIIRTTGTGVTTNGGPSQEWSLA